MDRRQLFRSIEARPDDLEPRQVYADWLIERGDQMGEFIQLECRLRREPESPLASKWRRRANALLREHRWWRQQGLMVELGGGMIERAEVGRDRARELDLLLQEAPALRALSFEGNTDEDTAPQLAAHPLWGRIRELDCTHGRELVLAALEAGSLRAVRRLSIRGSWMADRLTRLFDLLGARAPALTSLQCLSTPREAMPHLAASGVSLTELDLYRSPIELDVMRAIAGSDLLRGIESLRLGDTELGVDGVAALAASPRLATLRRLDLRRAISEPGGPAAGAVLRELINRAPKLASLELMGIRLGVEGVEALLDGLRADALAELSLHGCRIRDAGLARLVASPLAARLTAVNLKNNSLSFASAALLARAERLRPRLLNLDGNPITNKGRELLGVCEGLSGTTISAGQGSKMFPQQHNEKEGVWLGSTNYRVRDLIRKVRKDHGGDGGGGA